MPKTKTPSRTLAALRRIPQPVFSLFLAFCTSVFFCLYCGFNHSNNYLLFFIILFALFQLFQRAIPAFNKRRLGYSAIFSSLLSVALLMGGKITYATTNFSGFHFIDLFYFVTFFIIITSACLVFFNFLDHHQLTQKTVTPKLFTNKYFWLIAAAVILLCWLPFFLAYFPGLISVDSAVQFNQALQGEYSNWHPVLHTFLLGIFIQIGDALGNLTLGIALAVFVQMLATALIFGWIVRWTYKTFNKRWPVYLIWVFFALCPIVAAFAITPWKDIIFSALCLLLFTQLWDIIRQHRIARFTLRTILPLLLNSIIITFFRNGAIFIIITVAIVLFVYFKNNRRLIAALFLPAIFLVAIVQGPVYHALGITGSPFLESMSIPAQQLAYTAKYGQLTEDEWAALHRIADVEKLVTTYEPMQADAAKNSFDYDLVEANKGEFLKLWFSALTHNFRQYVAAYLFHAYAYWYPGAPSWSVAYGNTHDQTWLAGDYEDIALLGPHAQKLIYFSTRQMSSSIWLGWTTSVGFLIWFLIFTIFVYLYQKRSRRLLPLVFLFVYLILLFGSSPVSWIFRYVYFVFLLAPILVITWFTPHQTQTLRKEN